MALHGLNFGILKQNIKSFLHLQAHQPENQTLGHLHVIIAYLFYLFSLIS